jgi:hypothetical protein
MRDFRDAKTMAQTLRAALAAMGFKITIGQSLELIAQSFGVPDWNTLSAAIRSKAAVVPENTPRPPPTNLLSKQLESMPRGENPKKSRWSICCSSCWRTQTLCA